MDREDFKYDNWTCQVTIYYDLYVEFDSYSLYIQLYDENESSYGTSSQVEPLLYDNYMIFKLSRSAHEMYNIPASVGLESIYGTHNNGQGIIFTIELRFVEPWEGTID